MRQVTLYWCRAGVVAITALLCLPGNASKVRLTEIPEAGEQTAVDKGAPLTKIYYPPILPKGTKPPLQLVASDKRTVSGKPQAQAYLRKDVIFYSVKKGDTLTRIGRKFGVTARAIAHANAFPSVNKQIRPGQIIQVPVRRQTSFPSRGGLYGYNGGVIVQTALRYLGVPYRWAGTTSRGLDCSGLIQVVLAAHGIKAPHNAAKLHKLGLDVYSEDLQSGDLVFFANTYKRGISHVGFYIDHGQFIHASSARGRVTISNLSEDYYRKHYAGARRLY